MVNCETKNVLFLSFYRVFFGGGGGGGGGSWFFAHHCGICYEGGGGGRKKTYQIIGAASKNFNSKNLKSSQAPLYINYEPSPRIKK